MAPGGHHRRAHRLDQAALARVLAVRLALVRARAPRTYERGAVRLGLARARRPGALRRVPHFARATLEPAPRPHRALVVEPGSCRWCRDAAGRREPRPSGV